MTDLMQTLLLQRKVPRQFTDRTVHRHVFWRQFTDTFGDSSPTQFFQRMFMSMEIMFHILIEENVGKLKTKILRLMQYFEYRQATRMRRLMYENFLSQ